MGSVLTCVVASCKVVCCVFFAADELFGVEQLAVSPGPDLIDDGRFQIQEDGAWDVLSGPSLTEKRVEGVVSATNCFVAWHLSIRLQKKEKQKTLKLVHPQRHSPNRKTDGSFRRIW